MSARSVALQTNSMTYNYDTTQANHTGGLLLGGPCTCVIAALHCLKQKYKYKQTSSETLSSSDLVTSQISKNMYCAPYSDTIYNRE